MSQQREGSSYGVAEKAVWSLMDEKHRQFIASRPAHERKFIFGCHYLPLFCADMCSTCLRKIDSPKTGEGKIPLWLFPLFEPVLAQSRFIHEMRERRYDPTKIPNEEDECVYWTVRFLQWRLALQNSYRFFLNRECKDSWDLPPKITEAAIRGFIENQSGWPSKLTAGIIEEYRGDPVMREAFLKNAWKPKRRRWDEPEVDLWLIQIWPLVEGNNWNYADLFFLVGNKFKERSKPVFENTKAIESHCKAIDLRLSKKAQKYQGRPKRPASFRSSERPLPSMGRLAQQINAFPIKMDEMMLPPVLLDEMLPVFEIERQQGVLNRVVVPPI